jgi:hypothetical protein
MFFTFTKWILIMKIILLVLFLSFVISGCSVHEAWNGDKKPGLSYISIDKNGKVVSNNKSTELGTETLDKMLANNDSELSKTLNKEEKKLLTKILSTNSDRTTLFIWSAEYNGAMTNGEGKTCLQAATYARSKKVTADVSASLLSALGKIEISSSSSKEDKLLAFTLTETISKLNATSEQSTYLGAGLFGLCLLQANDGLTKEQVENATLELIKASSLSHQKSKVIPKT